VSEVPIGKYPQADHGCQRKDNVEQAEPYAE
jgi:hypothetical protein